MSLFGWLVAPRDEEELEADAHNDNDWTCRYCGVEYSKAQNKGDCDNCQAGYVDLGDGKWLDNNSGEYLDENDPDDYDREYNKGDDE